MRFAVSVIVVSLVGCGLDAGSGSPSTSQSSMAALCGSEAELNADGTATSVGCAFEQQYTNITHHGQRLATGEQLLAGGVKPDVTVTNRCGDWLLGADGAGVTVFVSSATGEVRSHGQRHLGFGSSSLPVTLTLPIELE